VRTRLAPDAIWGHARFRPRDIDGVGRVNRHPISAAAAPGPISTRLHGAYWALREEPAYRDAVTCGGRCRGRSDHFDESAMKLLDTLRDEHALIDRVVGSFCAYVGGLVDGTADPDDGRRFAAFFAEFVGHFHHDREERVLFPALVTEAQLPAGRGPVYALTREHAEMEQWLREIAPLLERRPQSEQDRARLRALATRYWRSLWRHVDAENSVLYPQAEERLRLCGVRELADRPISEAEAAAREDAAALLIRYLPIEDPVLTRGDGCFMCRAHGETCDGLEAEWWTELEWEEFYNRDASD